MSLEDREMAVEQEAVVAVLAQVDKLPESGNSVTFVPDERSSPRPRGRHRISYEDLPDNVMPLVEQIKIVSQRLRRRELPHAEFMALNKLLMELRERIKARAPRAPNGVNYERIRRAERAEKLNELKRQQAELTRGETHGN